MTDDEHRARLVPHDFSVVGDRAVPADVVAGAGLDDVLALDAHVVKAFNTLFAANQVDPILDGTRLDGFVAGDDAAAKATVLELVRSIGLRPIDAGPLARARELEALAWLNIALQGSLGNTWHTAWKLVGVPAGVVDGEKAAA